MDGCAQAKSGNTRVAHPISRGKHSCLRVKFARWRSGNVRLRLSNCASRLQNDSDRSPIRNEREPGLKTNTRWRLIGRAGGAVDVPLFGDPGIAVETVWQELITHGIDGMRPWPTALGIGFLGCSNMLQNSRFPADAGKPWWQTGVIYQIYPRSFQDANDDGVGDLPGIIHRLDYLKWLGVSAIWISPVYPSPMADFGYDITDHTAIHPLFGDMADMELLIQEAHQRGLRVIMDFVPNHTSDQHPWFRESCSSKSNPKRDWYLWADADEAGNPPNNWLAMFGGSAWEWHAATGQYYYHAFLKEQPDLNWRNPEVMEAMLGIMRFWLDKGVDGFRVDVLWHLIKDHYLRDNPINPDYHPQMSTYEQLLPVYSTDQPEVHEVICDMRKLLDEYTDRLMIGEVYLPIHKLVSYYGRHNDGAHLPFNFLLLHVPWDAQRMASAITEYEGALPVGGWPNWVLSNHDQPRVASRVGDEQSKIAAILLLTLRGTPTIYYGDELGMKDVAIPRAEIQDPQGLNMPDKNLSRDPARTPMLWNETANAGFSGRKPWLRVSADYLRRNVSLQQAQHLSHLTLYRNLIRLRNQEEALTSGSFKTLYADGQSFAFVREQAGARSFLVVLNLTHRPSYVHLPKPISARIVLSTAPELENVELGADICLNGDEGLVAVLLP